MYFPQNQKCGLTGFREYAMLKLLYSSAQVNMLRSNEKSVTVQRDGCAFVLGRERQEVREPGKDDQASNMRKGGKGSWPYRRKEK